MVSYNNRKGGDLGLAMVKDLPHFDLSSVWFLSGYLKPQQGLHHDSSLFSAVP